MPCPAACASVEAVSLIVESRNEATASRPVPSLLPVSADVSDCASDIDRGEGKSLGSNQLPRKSKKQELAQEQEEQKRTMRRAEQ